LRSFAEVVTSAFAASFSIAVSLPFGQPARMPTSARRLECCDR
jgi:hypothetical protein